ncbi:MAG: hypothetical protein AUG51_21610 [Acidobacteria bacterium 13_1_20CM_3_53_8]|nr:MAG: hypothetical protein AUG51_21610 [Acidobacteria bacterium 13_1_20CM_3_53_8]
MRVTPIGHPLAGERVVAVQPEMKPMVEAKWHRRLSFYTGRSLSDKALITEQVGRAGRLATRGQMVSPGIVNGLVVGLEHPPDIIIETIRPKTLDVATDSSEVVDASPVELVPMPPNLNYYLHISPGTAITASGEDVVITKNMRVPVGSVQVYTTTDILAKLYESNERVESADEIISRETTGRETSVERKVLSPRRLGPSLREFLSKGITDLPRAGILVLEPISLKRVGDYDAGDQCEQDPQNYAYEDWQLVDGCQLILYTWPTELTDILPLPDANTKGWRNRLAYTIFEAEMRGLLQEMLLPWEEIGVPIGLIGFDEDFAPLFIDRYSVVRAGGKPKRRSVLVPDIMKIVTGEVTGDSDAVLSLTPPGCDIYQSGNRTIRLASSCGCVAQNRS